MFTFAYLKRTELSVPVVSVTNTDNVSKSYTSITRIDAKHFFNNGVHTVVGELAMPTPCDLLTTEASVRESMPEQVELDFKVINNADTCAQVITAQRFMITAKANENAIFNAVFMNRPVELNLIPSAPGETPEEFELFIKG